MWRLSGATLSFLNGKQVQQRLGGMLVGAVACVQYRNVTGELRSQTRGAFLRMTHDDGVDIGADDGNGIGRGFAFLPSDVLLLSEKPTTLAPVRCMEVSKDKRVRVDASKKQLAITLCFNSSGCGLAF